MNSMQLKCFLTAAKRLSFTESAAELFISQPALSYNIMALEKEWGVELFIRDKKNKATRLTLAGEVMYEGIKNLQEQFEELLQKARSIQEGKSGILRIGIISSDRIDDYLMKVIDNFKEKFPDVDLILKRGSHRDLVQWLYNNTIDIAFALKIVVENKRQLAIKKLYSVESVLILPKKHPLAKKNNLSLKDFKNETFVSVSRNESRAINALLKKECQKAGFTPKILEAPDINSQVMYIESGKGVSIASINNIATFNRHITMLHLRDLKPMEMVIAYNRNSNNPCIEKFISSYEPAG
ncbi:MAG: LysR family transcriptional regulator [Firmicutes bacterium]|nr:LysR family transcriptional regulator [Bacillota bacterium]